MYYIYKIYAMHNTFVSKLYLKSWFMFHKMSSFFNKCSVRMN